LDVFHFYYLHLIIQQTPIMKAKIILSAFTFVFLFQIKVNAQSNSTEDINKKIEQVENNILPNVVTDGDKPMTIKQRMDFYKVKGMSIAVIHNYKIEWVKGYGWADDSLKLPVTIHTLFQAGSISKSLNAVGVLKLVQDKKIDLYADINTYLTSWKFPYDSLSGNKKITMANLLSHTGGLTVHGFEGYESGTPIPTIVQVLNGEKPANSPPIRSMYPAGIKSEYSGGGITISQLVVMDVTHQPYADYMYHNVLKPLGMTESTYEQPTVNVKPNLLAVGYRANGKAIPGNRNVYPEQAAAGLWTNPTDLSKYIIETQLAYDGKSQKVLNQETTKLRLTPYIDKNAALGCFIDNFDSTKYFQHGGADEGFRAQYYGSIEGGNGVVVMVNSDNGDIMNEVINSVAKVYGFKGLNHTTYRKTVIVPDSVLQKYTGEYEVKTGFIVSIVLENHQLYGQPSGQNKLPLFPQSQNKFFLKEMNIEVEFISNDKGEVTKAILYENGPHEIKKIK
jgi:CubicO group peptidase (beta-lactamase class C family)